MSDLYLCDGAEPAPAPAFLIKPHRQVPRISTRRARGPLTDEGRGFLMAIYKPHPKGALAKEFFLPVRNDAMRPMLGPGDRVLFSTRVEPSPGDCVLVGTEFGPDIRMYEQASKRRWVGHALNDDYEPISTADERAWVIAVLVGIEVAHV